MNFFNSNYPSLVNANISNTTIHDDEDIEELTNANNEIIQVISKGKNSKFRTPSSSAKTSSNQNPFINAPFTAKKNCKPFPFSLDELEKPPPLVLPKSPELTAAQAPATQPKPEIPLKPTDLQVKVQQQQQLQQLQPPLPPPLPQSQPQPQKINMARNLKSEINVLLDICFFFSISNYNKLWLFLSNVQFLSKSAFLLYNIQYSKKIRILRNSDNYF